MFTYKLLVLVHLVSAFLIVSAMVISPMVFRLAKGTRNVRELGMLIRIAGRIPKFTIPGSFVALLSGTALVSIQQLGFGAAWISAAYALWILSFLTAGAVLRPHVAKGPVLVEKIVASGAMDSDELQAFATDRRTFMAARAIDLFTFMVILLMVFKPGA